MDKHAIPCARYETVHDLDSAQAAAARMGIPLVVKASGLAAGKGAIVCLTTEELDASLKRMFIDREFGAASDEVVLEEYLEGEEASCLALTDGNTFVPLVSSQDHKPIYDGDKGPNTGGMGAYAPAPVLDEAMQRRVNREILEPVVKGMAEDGTPYRGVLYAGLMITENGPKIIEFNCRFGDPETQAVLPLLESDLVELMRRVTKGALSADDVSFYPGSAVCVVLASGGYPGAYEKGKTITGLNALPPEITVFHAGTAAHHGETVTAGGRVLGVTAKGRDIKEAIDRAYGAIPRIHFEHMYYRKDIGAKALKRVT